MVHGTPLRGKAASPIPLIVGTGPAVGYQPTNSFLLAEEPEFHAPTAFTALARIVRIIAKNPEIHRALIPHLDKILRRTTPDTTILRFCEVHEQLIANNPKNRVVANLLEDIGNQITAIMLGDQGGQEAATRACRTLRLLVPSNPSASPQMIQKFAFVAALDLVSSALGR